MPGIQRPPSELIKIGARVAAGTESPVAPAWRPRSETSGRATGNKPTVNLIGGVDYANPNLRISRSGQVAGVLGCGVNVNWNFFDFGRTNAQAAEAAATVSATSERLAELDDLVTADVEQRLLDLQSASAMVCRAASGPKRGRRGAVVGGSLSRPAWRRAPMCSLRRWRCSKASWRGLARWPSGDWPRRVSNARWVGRAMVDRAMVPEVPTAAIDVRAFRAGSDRSWRSRTCRFR